MDSYFYAKTDVNKFIAIYADVEKIIKYISSVKLQMVEKTIRNFKLPFIIIFFFDFFNKYQLLHYRLKKRLLLEFENPIKSLFCNNTVFGSFLQKLLFATKFQ